METEIGDSGATSLTESLKINSSLTHLDLTLFLDLLSFIVFHINENDIGKSGALALTEALKVNSTITVMKLTQSCLLFMDI